MRAVIITGATRGIGFAAARSFFEAGYRVINVARTALSEFDAKNIAADFADPNWDNGFAEQLAPLVQGAERVCVVHNAAQASGGSVFEALQGTLQHSLQVNLLAPFRLTQLVRGYLQPGSSVLFVGSTLSEKAVAGYSPYIISKHALVGLMRSTCQDLLGTGIHTACICPGFVDTPLLRERCDDALLQRIKGQIAFGRLVEPTEVARLLLFSADNPALNGAVLHANLGEVER